mgnify:CR=1 FL=1|tara:strand:- start:2188 stop:3177 length:990 start_codon:yes stop_codon:yes gene_type:complete
MRFPTGLFFFLSFNYLVFGQNTKTFLEVEELLIKGQELADDNQFSVSLKVLNQAIGLLKQSPRTHPLRIEAEKVMKITKGRALVARFQSGKLKSVADPNQLLPREKETKDFLITQAFGTVLARQIWEKRNELRAKQTLGLGRRITVLPNGGIELMSTDLNGISVRTIQAASFEVSKKNQTSLHSGSFVFHSVGETSKIHLDSPLTEIRLSSSGPFAFMVGVTTNGGMKVIGLLGEVMIRSGMNSMVLLPGELTFALPEGFSRKMNVELSTLIVTSNLLTDFEKPPVFLKKLRQQAMMQALRTRKRFRTVVGDVKGNDNFELRVLQEDSR